MTDKTEKREIGQRCDDALASEKWKIIGDCFPEQEAQRRFETALRGAVNTLPRPMKESAPARAAKSKREPGFPSPRPNQDKR